MELSQRTYLSWRSRDFATKALLAWASTGLETYRRQLATPANVYLSNRERDAINAVEGLGPRLLHLAHLREAVLGPEKEMVVLLVWRNRIVHTHSREMVIHQASSAVCLRIRACIATDYHGLDIQRAIDERGAVTRRALRKLPRW